MIMTLPLPLYYLLFKIDNRPHTWFVGPLSFAAVLAVILGLVKGISIPYFHPAFLVGVFAGLNLTGVMEKYNRKLSILDWALTVAEIIYIMRGKELNNVLIIVLIFGIWFATDLLGIGSKAPACFLNMFQPFITIWTGKESLLTYEMVILFPFTSSLYE